MEGRDQPEPRRLAHLGECHRTRGNGDQRPDHDPQQDRDIGDEPTGKARDQKDRDKHDGRNQDIAQRRIGRVVHLGRQRQSGRHLRHAGYAACGDPFGDRGQPCRMGGVHDLRRGGADRVAENPVDPDPHQADPDHKDDRPGHHRGEESQHPADEGRNQHRDHPRRHDRTKDGAGTVASALGIGHGHHRADGGKGHAHHHRQADAEPLRRPQRLDQRDDAADEQIGRNQKGHIGRFQFQRAPDDQRHGHRAGIHHQHMLKAKGKQLGCWQNFIHRMDRLGHEFRSFP